MTETATLPRPWSVRQRETLREFMQQAATRARNEVEVPGRFIQSEKANEKEFREATERVEEEFRQATQRGEQKFSQERQSALAEYQAQSRKLAQEKERRCNAAQAEFDSARQALIVKFKEARWSIRTVYESDRKVTKDNLRLALSNARTAALRVVTARQKGYQLVRMWKVLEEPPKPLASQDYKDADAVGALDNCGLDAEQSLADLRKMRLPRFVRGIGPHLCLILLWALASIPAYFLQEWHWWLLGSTLLVVPPGLWACRKLKRWTHARVLELFNVQHQAVADARALHTECVRLAKHYCSTRMKALKKRTLQQLTDLRAATGRRMHDLKQRCARRVEATRAKFDPLIQKLRQDYLATEKAEAARQQQEQAATKARYDAALKEASDRFAAQRAENHRRRGVEWSKLVAEWTLACAHLTRIFQEIDRESQRWFGDWDPKHHPEDRGLPWSLRFGMLTVKAELIPGSVPADAELPAVDFGSFRVPALLPFPERASLLLEAGDKGRAEGLKALEAILLRAWLALPPGKLRCTIIDPVGRGQNFSAFMHLDDFEPSLVNSRIWTEAQHIEERLADLTAHMETVLQKFLRNQFESLAEYNAQAGEVAEPFRFLVVANFPTSFTPEACRRLISLASAGARCGICVFILADMRHDLPQSMSWADLEKTCTMLRWRDDRYVIQDEIYARFPLQLEQLPSEEQCTAILQEVGARAVRAMKVEVPFASIAPVRSAWWTEDSRAGFMVPLGRAGANRLQHLALGQGTSQHVLIAGKTGSGKSTLFHVLIMQLVLRYSPDEVELYLVDFKKGVEFKTYASHALPHARVVAVESEREFGLSVLQKLDAELSRRGEIYRQAGVTDLASYRNLHHGNGKPVEQGTPLAPWGRGVGGEGSCRSPSPQPSPPGGEGAVQPPMPRIAFIVDEFQEFFVEDDKIAQEASLLLDRLVRQGRAFGMHIFLGSQTLGGAYSLARSTIDQMAVRIALQCSEADANLILSRENTEARLLSRPGEAIYNAANGLLEGNNFFQIVWLDDDRRDDCLRDLQNLWQKREVKRTEPLVVFEGNVLADMRNNPDLSPLAPRGRGAGGEGDSSWSAWLGDAVAIKEPTRAIFRRHSGSNLLFVGQQDHAALAMFVSSALSLANALPSPPLRGRGVGGEGVEEPPPPHHQPLSPEAGERGADALPMVFAHAVEGLGDEIVKALPEIAAVNVTPQRDLPALLIAWAEELEKRNQGESPPTPRFLFLYGLHRMRDVRKPDDDFGYSRKGEEQNPYRILVRILREGPPLGLFVIAWCDTVGNLHRCFDRSTLREFEMRVIFQMSANDSSTLTDTPAASKLGPQRAIFYTEDQGKLEKFRPYALPAVEWLRALKSMAQPAKA